jgi:hypothetical protein
MKTKGVLMKRTPALHWIDCVISCYFGRDSSEFTESFCHLGIYSPVNVGGF